MKKMEFELTLNDKDKLRRLADFIPLVKYALIYIERLESQVRSYERASEAINQALNEGDGVYRP